MKNKRLILICSSLLSTSLFTAAIAVPIIVGSESVSDVVNNNPVKNVSELNNWFGSTNFNIQISNDIHSVKSKNELNLLATDNYIEIDDLNNLTQIIGIDTQVQILNKPNNIKFKYKLVRIVAPQRQVVSSTIFEYTLSIAISANLNGEQTNSNPKNFKITSNIISTLQSELDAYVSGNIQITQEENFTGNVTDFDNLVELTANEWVEVDNNLIASLGLSVDYTDKPEDVSVKFQITKGVDDPENFKYEFTVKAETNEGKNSSKSPITLNIPKN